MPLGFSREFLLTALLASSTALASCSQPDTARSGSTPSTSGNDWRRAGAANLHSVPVGRYVIGSGDTLFGIAQRYDVSLRQLIIMNGLRPPYLISVGQSLLIPANQTHKVSTGETLYGISRRYGVDVTTLSNLNRIGPPFTLRVGQVLALPSSVSVPTGAVSTLSQRSASAVPRAVPLSAQGARSVTTSRRPAANPDRKIDGAEIAALPADIAPLADPPPRSESTFAWPVHGTVTQRFGRQTGGGHNDGITIEAPGGAAVRAAENGVVAYASDELRGFGNLVLVRHADNWMSAYGHNDVLLVRRGDIVVRGQEIARIGATGAAGVPKLHFELRRGSQAKDPLKHLKGGKSVASRN